MRAVAALAASVALVLGACTGPPADVDTSPTLSGDIDQITVGSSDTQAPSLTYEQGLEYDEAQTRLLWDGEGERLVSGQPLLLDVYGESLDSGDVVINTFDGSPEAYVLTPESVGQALYDVLVDARVGARVLALEPAELIPQTEQDQEAEDEASEDDGHDTVTEAPPVGLVVDVRSEHAVGEAQEPKSSMPEVVVDESGEPRVVIAEDAEPVADLQTATLIQGIGPQITATSRVTMNYAIFYYEDGETEGTNDDGESETESWSAGDVFDSTWPVERAPYLLDMESGAVVSGMTAGLLDQTEGSRVELLVPSSMGYPLRGTMIMVIDILDVWNAEDM
ncbi:FKBP-type peptidyl-prolyl cis-trans isomerase [Demequina sp. B12]|uniref:FKBP-type peptidyl-prolyl cis-trans isomerase n=1 Tax=Demequina sp. B12 TaxID=2992757 RepID=UPI00237BEA10|nr:FKBP-type peptidyl-prolyl cis-trans isomerase [Demequina sp. B12]MDE0573197.1 FKBP-type peptidyl-prolyl cis-trans isomerase [Demequina sp. B12]